MLRKPKRLARLLSKMLAPLFERRPKTRPGVSFRPRVEALEAREVPAGVTLTWTNDGGDGLFSNPNNWDEGGKPASAAPPGYADFLEFDGSVTSAPCVGLTGSYTSIYIRNFSTIDLGGNVQTGLLELAGGVIRNTANGQNITVTGELNWTAGTINASTYSGALNIDGSVALDGFAGATALIAPAGGGTVNLGSNLNFENGAVGTMMAGTVEFINDGIEFNIKSDSAFNLNSGALASAVMSVGLGVLVGPEIVVWPGTSLTFEDEAFYRIEGTLLNSGTVSVWPDAFVLIKGNDGDDVAIWQGASFGGVGETYLWGGSTLTAGATKVAQFTAGILATVSDNGAGSGNCSAILGGGAVELAGADIYINYGAILHASFGTLSFAGNVLWSSGTFYPYVQGDIDEGLSDVLKVLDGTLTITGGSISPIAVDAEWIPTSPTIGNSWLLFEAVGGITGTPSYNSGIWRVDPDGGNPALAYYLTAW